MIVKKEEKLPWETTSNYDGNLENDPAQKT
jgi:hypothetical protein